MGGSSRRNHRRTDGGGGREDDREEENPTWNAFSTLLIWILATSSLIVVISPTSPSISIPSPPPPSHQIHPRFFSFEPSELVLGQDSISKMYANMDDSNMYGAPQDQYAIKNVYPPHMISRRQGIRYRDDSQLMTIRPILTEHRSASPFGRGPSTSNHPPSLSASSSDYSDSPSLMDMDAIDIHWRNDIDVAKGAMEVSVADQYELDLQMLTAKSADGPLSHAESARYEECAKSLYNGFLPSVNGPSFNHPQKYQQQQQQQVKSTVVQEYPTNNNDQYQYQEKDDLAELLVEMTQEDSSLNAVFNPVINNVSLSEAMVYTQANITEMQELQDPSNQLQLNLSPSSSSSGSTTQPDTLFNTTDPETVRQWIQPTEMGPADVFPQSNYLYVGMHNDSMQTVVSNGNVDYDHAYSAPTELSPLVIGASSSSVGQQTSPTSASVTSAATASLYDSYRHQHSGQRHSFSDCTTDASTPCSRLSSESPRYHSESSSSSITESRFYGKLAPARGSRIDRPSSPGTKIGRVIPLASGQRKRGRQSKDEQLASENALPVSAREISEMTLSDLQQMLKNESLNEYQRQLIRKIRRRGKNKVAARTCRQRRTDRHDKTFSRQMYH